MNSLTSKACVAACAGWFVLGALTSAVMVDTHYTKLAAGMRRELDDERRATFTALAEAKQARRELDYCKQIVPQGSRKNASA